MSAEIIPFRKEALTGEQELERQAHLARTTEAFARRVDYNIRGASGIGQEYISRVLQGIFRSIIASQGKYSDIDTYMRIDYQITQCSIFDCARLIQEVDDYLTKIHVQESPEKEFFTYVRNIAFIRKNSLRNTQSEI